MSTPPNRKRAIALSNALFILMVVAAAVVAYLYFIDDRFFNEGPEAPPCEAGRNELVCVVHALKAQEFNHVDFGRYTVTANQLTQPGQVIQINDMTGFLFVYPAATADEGIAAREADGADVDPATLEITARTAERPIGDGDTVHVVQHSNVIFVLVGGTDDDAAKVQAALESLP